ncbi:MAG: alpha/beta hydrolase family protein, partial [Casimicrobiaceae bacterium]
QEVRLTSLNPQFSAAQWGTMKAYSWTDAKGRRWDGGLMVPADFKPRHKYPLVIQTYGFSPTRFYRDGSNIYDGFTSGFAGRAFLREGLLVLALPWRASSGAPSDEHESIVAFGDGVRAAIQALVTEGLADRERVGIMGWSATGVRVLNLLTFTDVPIRAATMMDGDSNTLYSMTITYAVTDGIQAMKERANQGGPFGESRERWIRNDPSLHTDCIRAALRIESYSAEPKNNWDIYALLRRQYRPVELIKFPEGSHALSRPSERMISLQGNVDWYRFWLKGERRSELLIPAETAESLREQYARWDQMVPLKLAADAAPSCARVAVGD